MLGLRFVLTVGFSTAKQSVLEMSDTPPVCFPNVGYAKVPRITENIPGRSSAPLLHSKEIQNSNQRWMERGTPAIAGSSYAGKVIMQAELALRQ